MDITEGRAYQGLSSQFASRWRRFARTWPLTSRLKIGILQLIFRCGDCEIARYFWDAKRRYWPLTAPIVTTGVAVIGGIVLQKSKVAGRLIFREITKREAIANSYIATNTTSCRRATDCNSFG